MHTAVVRGLIGKQKETAQLRGGAVPQFDLIEQRDANTRQMLVFGLQAG
jgi:hypothetical protein